MVSEPSLEVQETVEERRNSARATRGLQRVSTMPLSACQRRLGFPPKPEAERCELGFSPEQRLTQQHCAFLPHQLLLVFIYELWRAHSAKRTGTAPPQYCSQCRDDILTRAMTFFKTVKKGKFLLKDHIVVRLDAPGFPRVSACLRAGRTCGALTRETFYPPFIPTTSGKHQRINDKQLFFYLFIWSLEVKVKDKIHRFINH